MKKELLYGAASKEILSIFFHVHNTLGYGFLEKVHENALALS